MITHSFDNSSEAIISPAAFFGEKNVICDTAIVTFSSEIDAAVLARYPHETIAELHPCNRTRPIHLLTLDGGKKAVFYLTEIGSTLAATDVIEVNWLTGAEHFILFGSAGALDREATQGKYVVPTAAYRDEGMSYHYAPPSDYISIPNADFVADVLRQCGLPYVKGRVWTTDAMYRETRALVQQRKSEGCLAVEMELAGVQAVCDYYGFQLYDFLVTGDILDQPKYSVEGLYEANHAPDNFDVALEIARRIG